MMQSLWYIRQRKYQIPQRGNIVADFKWMEKIRVIEQQEEPTEWGLTPMESIRIGAVVEELKQ